MNLFNPVSRKEFSDFMEQRGFRGPFQVGDHEFLIKENISVKIPDKETFELEKAIPFQIFKNAGLISTNSANLEFDFKLDL